VFEHCLCCTTQGSSSIPNDLKVIANEETVKADQVHVVRFGKGERFANETSQALSEGVVEPLNMGCQTGAFTDCLVLVVRQHSLIGSLPKLLTSRLTSPAHDTGDHLPRLLT
jgi:hypothetical protein